MDIPHLVAFGNPVAEDAVVLAAVSVDVFLDGTFRFLVASLVCRADECEIEAVEGQFEQGVCALAGIAPTPVGWPEPDAEFRGAAFEPTTVPLRSLAL